VRAAGQFSPCTDVRDGTMDLSVNTDLITFQIWLKYLLFIVFFYSVVPLIVIQMMRTWILKALTISSAPLKGCTLRKILQPLLIYLWLGVSGNGDIIDECPCIGWKCGWQATYWGLLKSTGLSKNGAQIFPADALCSVATVMTYLFQNNWIIMPRQFAKVVRIFEEIDDIKNRRVI